MLGFNVVFIPSYFIGKDYLSVAFGMVLLLQGICSLIGPPIAGRENLTTVD